MLHRALHRDRQPQVETERGRHGRRGCRNEHDARKTEREFPDHPQPFRQLAEALDDYLGSPI
jgi:hypothetical protein